MENTEKMVRCISCRKEVKVKLIRYGKGFIAICPICKSLAYNSKGGE